MEDLHSLSNEDLKYRLTQFGFANLPVTSTTRNVLIKKLRKHMETEKSKLRRETSYATRYSSDEELSNTEKDKSVKKRAAAPRSTIAAISQPSGRNSRSGLSNPTMPPPSPKRTQPTTWGASPTTKPKSTVYVSPLIQSGSDSDEESDSNSAIADVGLGSSFLSRYSSNLSATGISPRATLSGPYNGVDDDLSTQRYSTYGGVRNRFYGAATDEVDLTAPSSSLDGSPTNGVHHGEDPNAHDFTKRLLSFRNRNMVGNLPSSGSTVPSLSTCKCHFVFS